MLSNIHRLGKIREGENVLFKCGGCLAVSSRQTATTLKHSEPRLHCMKMSSDFSAYVSGCGMNAIPQVNRKRRRKEGNYEAISKH